MPSLALIVITHSGIAIFDLMFLERQVHLRCGGIGSEHCRAGMSRYNAKPFRLDDVRKAITSAMERAQLRRENRQLCNQVNDGRSGMRIITQDATMQRLRETAQQIAPTGCNVLITGESGTGKELQTNGLFGHGKGAFTGAGEKRSGSIEVADGGSLFLDEIGDMLLASRSSCCATTTSRGTSANWKT